MSESDSADDEWIADLLQMTKEQRKDEPLRLKANYL